MTWPGVLFWLVVIWAATSRGPAIYYLFFACWSFGTLAVMPPALSIGNLTPEPRAEFLATLAGVMRPGDSFLLGTDLVKDAGRLVRAYDDAAGVTAKFNRNVLAVINRELDADFDVVKLRQYWPDNVGDLLRRGRAHGLESPLFHLAATQLAVHNARVRS